MESVSISPQLAAIDYVFITRKMFQVRDETVGCHFSGVAQVCATSATEEEHVRKPHRKRKF